MFQFSDKLCPAGNAFKTAAEQNSFNLSQKRIFYKCSEAGIIYDNFTYKASRIWQGKIVSLRLTVLLGHSPHGMEGIRAVRRAGSRPCGLSLSGCRRISERTRNARGKQSACGRPFSPGIPHSSGCTACSVGKILS